MKASLTSDQLELQSSLRKVFDQNWSTTGVRELRLEGSDGFPAKLWSALVRVGMFGLPFPLALGGEGASLFELGLGYLEGGRALCPTLVDSTLVFGLAVEKLGTDDQRQAWIPKLVKGEVRATAALWSTSGVLDEMPQVTATQRGDEWRLHGTADFVANGDSVDVLLVGARTAGGGGSERIGGYFVTPGTPGVSMRRLRTFAGDIQCKVMFDDCGVASSSVLGEPSDQGLSANGLHWLQNAATSLQCMAMVGGGQSVIDRTVAYIGERNQFGRPIGSFQAAQHHIANIQIGIDGARLTTYQALWWLSEGAVAERELTIAKARVNAAYKDATLTAHQLHGGMGFLRESDLHLWSEHAKANELKGGISDVQMLRLGAALGFSA